ncbi:hypothetical protein BC834DRAFT_1018163 [Gloeopeniophorella convolvens]|nr:hypothetical protein BC834DRAFT_1018163 [Gloeopeniophorella convolvens]
MMTCASLCLRTAIGMAILYYDHLLNLDDETRFVWIRPMTKTKVLFVLYRYGTNIGYLHSFFDLMVVRLYSLWDRRKHILRILLVGLLISCAAVLFDLFVLVMTVVNAAERPRSTNVKIVSELLRDGIITFLVR